MQASTETMTANCDDHQQLVSTHSTMISNQAYNCFQMLVASQSQQVFYEPKHK